MVGVFLGFVVGGSRIPALYWRIECRSGGRSASTGRGAEVHEGDGGGEEAAEAGRSSAPRFPNVVCGIVVS